MNRHSDGPLGLILAGGRSSRMGSERPKPLLEIGGRSMIERVADRLRPFTRGLLVATDRPELYADLGARLLCDHAPGYAGPLAGLQAAALHVLGGGAPFPGLVSTPSDTPFLPADLVPRLMNGAGPHELRVASFEGRLHPVCALWPPSLLARVSALHLDAAQAPSLQSVMQDHGFTAVPFPPAADAPRRDPFFNVNTPSDLETALRFADSRG